MRHRGGGGVGGRERKGEREGVKGEEGEKGKEGGGKGVRERIDIFLFTYHCCSHCSQHKPSSSEANWSHWS